MNLFITDEQATKEMRKMFLYVQSVARQGRRPKLWEIEMNCFLPRNRARDFLEVFIISLGEIENWAGTGENLHAVDSWATLVAHDVYSSIRRFIKAHRFSPTFREIANMCGISHTHAREVVDQLARLGFLNRTEGVTRSIHLLIDADLIPLDSSGNSLNIRRRPYGYRWWVIILKVDQ